MSFFFINCSSKDEIRTITTKDLKVLLEKDSIQLLDVRSPTEVNEGSIKTAFFANYFDADFYSKASKQLDKTKPVYLYCRTGNRSSKASIILKEKGFNVVNVIGGYNQWQNEN